MTGKSIDEIMSDNRNKPAYVMNEVFGVVI